MTAVLQRFGNRVPEAQRTYRRFVSEGQGKGSPWEQLQGQIFLGDDGFLDRMDRLVPGRRLDNVLRCQVRPARLDKQTILVNVAHVYGLSVGDLQSRHDSEAYRMAVWLLRRKANLPLRDVAEVFAVSASRISHIQCAFEGKQPSARELEVMALCNVKQ